jgi:hypothetical protein
MENSCFKHDYDNHDLQLMYKVVWIGWGTILLVCKQEHFHTFLTYSGDITLTILEKKNVWFSNATEILPDI